MKRLLFQIILALFFLGASIPLYAQDPAAPADGSSIEKAIVLKDLADLNDILLKEEEFLSEKFGVLGQDWKIEEQDALIENSRHYDKITVQLTSTGQFKAFYFDITQPFEQFNLIQENNSLES